MFRLLAQGPVLGLVLCVLHIDCVGFGDAKESLCGSLKGPHIPFASPKHWAATADVGGAFVIAREKPSRVMGEFMRRNRIVGTRAIFGIDNSSGDPAWQPSLRNNPPRDPGRIPRVPGDTALPPGCATRSLWSRP